MAFRSGHTQATSFFVWCSAHSCLFFEKRPYRPAEANKGLRETISLHQIPPRAAINGGVIIGAGIPIIILNISRHSGELGNVHKFMSWQDLIVVIWTIHATKVAY